MGVCRRATSALDTESELAVRDHIDRRVVDRTLVVIAHRLSTIRRRIRIRAGSASAAANTISWRAAAGLYAYQVSQQTR